MLCSSWLLAGPDAWHHGRYGSEGLLHARRRLWQRHVQDGFAGVSPYSVLGLVRLWIHVMRQFMWTWLCLHAEWLVQQQ